MTERSTAMRTAQGPYRFCPVDRYETVYNAACTWAYMNSYSSNSSRPPTSASEV